VFGSHGLQTIVWDTPRVWGVLLSVTPHRACAVPACGSPGVSPPANDDEDAKAAKRCDLVAGDVKNSKFCKKAVDKTAQTFGKLNLLVKNAAFHTHTDQSAASPGFICVGSY
jgi:NAD(P)-dependent dehydrogenase (short-subunit alcohol dehydrogenase family)